MAVKDIMEIGLIGLIALLGLKIIGGAQGITDFFGGLLGGTVTATPIMQPLNGYDVNIPSSEISLPSERVEEIAAFEEQVTSLSPTAQTLLYREELLEETWPTPTEPFEEMPGVLGPVSAIGQVIKGELQDSSRLQYLDDIRKDSGGESAVSPVQVKHLEEVLKATGGRGIVSL